jgi:adenosyl cobinamide kinase/adenosyl cobinamide phosphate guanylyltransferase
MTDSPDQKTKIKNALSVSNILNQNIIRLPFEGDWFDAFRQPQNRGVWFVWGGSGSGKSEFLMKLAKELAKTHKVLYNLLEEETDDSDYIDRVERNQMHEVKDNFHTQSYNYDQLCIVLDKRGSAKVVFIDSITYLTKDFDKYMELKKRYKNKIFILSGHAEGKNPRSEFEKSIMYDAKMKIFVSGYAAYCKGRTIGPNGGLFIIYKEGYDKIKGGKN